MVFASRETRHAERLFALCGPLLMVASVAIAGDADSHFDLRVANPAFVTRHPHVVIDQAHHNFHTMDTRYHPLAELLAHDGSIVERGRALFTLESLGSVDVLVISNALGHDNMEDSTASHAAFSPDECAAVRAWVNQGGALLLIADHAPMGAAAEALGRAFGVDMRNGYAIDPVQGDRREPSHVWYEAGRGLGVDHAIVRGRSPGERVRKVHTFTGQSLAGPPGSTSLLSLSDQAEDLMVGLGGAGAQVPAGKRRSAAGRSQGLAFEYGKGRVVVLGEAAMMTAQIDGFWRTRVGMNEPGNDDRQFALNVVRWLARAL